MLSILRTRAQRSYSLGILVTLTVGMSGLLSIWTVLSRGLDRFHLTDERLCSIMTEQPKFGLRLAPETSQFRLWQKHLTTFERLEAYAQNEGVLRTDSGGEVIQILDATPGLFELFGLGPIAGRALTDSDYRNSETVALATERFARSRLGGVDGAIGAAATVNGGIVRIVGVIPDRPITFGTGAAVDLAMLNDYQRESRVHVVGRLRTGISKEQAQAELSSVDPGQNSKESPDGARPRVFAPIDMVESNLVRMFWMAVLGGVLLWIITCSNLLHLSLAREEGLAKADATRWALGARRWHLFSWRSKRATAIGAVATLIAIVLTTWTLTLLQVALPQDLQVLNTVDIGSVRIATLILVAFALSFALELPGIVRPDHLHLRSLLADARFTHVTAKNRTFTYVYLASLVGTAFVFTVAAYLILGTLIRLGQREPGFQPTSLTVATIRLPAWKYTTEPQRTAFFTQLTSRVREVNVVDSYALASSVPPASGVFIGNIVITPDSRPLSSISLINSGPNYFDALGQKVLAGREFRQEEIGSNSVVIVSATTAAMFGPTPDQALGRQIRFNKDVREIVGVVSDFPRPGQTGSLTHQVYWPINRFRPTMTLLVRSSSEVVPALRTVLKDLDSDAILDAQSMQDRLQASFGEPRFLAKLFSGIAVLTGILAVLGVFAVLSAFAVRQRSAIAVHMAVGATRSDVAKRIVSKGLLYAVFGIAAGWLLSYPFCRLLSEQLFQAESSDVGARIVASVMVLSAAFMASLLPALAASNVTPADLLKEI